MKQRKTLPALWTGSAQESAAEKSICPLKRQLFGRSAANVALQTKLADHAV
jgi:hypothetical protein